MPSNAVAEVFAEVRRSLPLCLNTPPPVLVHYYGISARNRHARVLSPSRHQRGDRKWHRQIAAPRFVPADSLSS